VSSFARPGFACRHNLAVWRGEDYIGIGEGAHGREGRLRTVAQRDGRETTELETDVDDARERALFALRLTEGLDLGQTVHRWPCLAPSVRAWRRALTDLVPHGIVRSAGLDRFALTARGFEVCDAVMASLLEAETEAR
jgi:oxygen-independent coproporphyrinogen-3 oxidase